MTDIALRPYATAYEPRAPQTDGALWARLYPPPDAREPASAAFAEIRSWPEYRPSPVVALPGWAGRMGVGQVWCKHEGERFAVGSFKSIGPPYAMLTVLMGEASRRLGRAITSAELASGALAEVTRDITVSAASSGNHGRALAWGARKFGCRSVVYMTEHVSAGRERAIAGFGAEVVRVPGPYENAVNRAAADVADKGYFVIAGVRLRDYPSVPADILVGYSLLAAELVDQLGPAERATHVFVSGGGGRLAASVVGHLHHRLGRAAPKVVVVEPTESDCLRQSALAGRPARASGSGRSVLDGLVVEEPSLVAWPILAAGAAGFLCVPDAAAVDALRLAADGPDGDRPLVIGDTGIGAFAGLLAAASDPALRAALGLGADSRVVVIASEGATDPEVYRALVRRTPEAVLAGRAGDSA
jgi:diaminopropionate ammonia-lyase